MNRIYLDHAATTKIHPEVLEAMLPYLTDKFGNASSIHSFGQEARAGIDQARQQVADVLSCEPQEIIFTGSTTESDNLAIKGVVEAFYFSDLAKLKTKKTDDSHMVREGRPYQNQNKNKAHVITSPIEHHAAIDICHDLEEKGLVELSILKVDKYGLVDIEEIKNEIKDNTVIVNVMYANNEVGTVEPIQEIGEVIKKTKRQGGGLPYFHTDAAAAAEYLTLDVKKLGVDLMSIGPHKFGGPKGVGILYAKKGTKIVSQIKGGSQEYGLRASTENVVGIVGAGKAVLMLASRQKELSEHVMRLRDRLIKGVLSTIPDSHLTGHPEKRVAHIASFVIKGAEGEAMLLMLDQAGIAASSGSACTSGLLEPSHVLLAMGIPAEEAHGSLRFSLGSENTEEEVDFVIGKLAKIVERLRRMAPK